MHGGVEKDSVECLPKESVKQGHCLEGICS